jgi:hypothetical protein
VPAGPEWLPSPPYRLTLEQYERMVDEGIIGAHDRVQLINGIPVHQRSTRPTHPAPVRPRPVAGRRSGAGRERGGSG